MMPVRVDTGIRTSLRSSFTFIRRSNIMMVRHFIVIGLVAAAFVAGRAWPTRSSVDSALGMASPAYADELVTETGWPFSVVRDDVVRPGVGMGSGVDGFVSTSGGNAYLWKRNGDRIDLVGQCAVVEEDVRGQASYLWLPGIERRP
jgi:hypothetical protein